jgi:hypothetical protein
MPASIALSKPPNGVSRIIRRAEDNNYIATYLPDKALVNLAGNYNYMERGYYASQDHELEGRTIFPTCQEMIDAYVPPLFLEKARLAGFAIPEFYISNSYFEPPVIIDPINPFMIKSRIVHEPGREHSIARSMTRNFKYAMCCQVLPPGSRVIYFRTVLGWCVSPRFRDISDKIWREFHIPLAKVRVIITLEGQFLVSDISHLPFDKLGERELNHLEKLVRWGE